MYMVCSKSFGWRGRVCDVWRGECMMCEGEGVLCVEGRFFDVWMGGCCVEGRV